MSTTSSPNMGLPLPGVSNEPGPQWAVDLNNSLTIIDSHNHSLGNGSFINANGINLTMDLPLNVNNLTTVRTVRFSPVTPTSSTDVGIIYLNQNNSLVFVAPNGVQTVLASSGFATTGTFNSTSGTLALTGNPPLLSFITPSCDYNAIKMHTGAPSSGTVRVWFTDSNESRYLYVGGSLDDGSTVAGVPGVGPHISVSSDIHSGFHVLRSGQCLVTSNGGAGQPDLAWPTQLTTGFYQAPGSTGLIGVASAGLKAAQFGLGDAHLCVDSPGSSGPGVLRMFGTVIAINNSSVSNTKNQIVCGSNSDSLLVAGGASSSLGAVVALNGSAFGGGNNSVIDFRQNNTSVGQFTQAGNLVAKGTVTSDSADPGNVGEYASSAVVGVSFGDQNIKDMTVISLSPGDWDVSVNFCGLPQGSNVKGYNFGIGLASGNSTSGLIYGDTFSSILASTTSANVGNVSGSIAGVRKSLPSPANIYLKASAGFDGATAPLANGRISARRVR